MLYAPWPEGPVAAAFVFFFLLAQRPPILAKGKRQGGDPSLAMGSAVRAALDGGMGQNYLALPLKEEEKRRSNRQPSSAARGRGVERTSPPGFSQESWGFAGRASLRR